MLKVILLRFINILKFISRSKMSKLSPAQSILRSVSLKIREYLTIGYFLCRAFSLTVFSVLTSVIRCEYSLQGTGPHRGFFYQGNQQLHQHKNVDMDPSDLMVRFDQCVNSQ